MFFERLEIMSKCIVQIITLGKKIAFPTIPKVINVINKKLDPNITWSTTNKMDSSLR